MDRAISSAQVEEGEQEKTLQPFSPGRLGPHEFLDRLAHSATSTPQSWIEVQTTSSAGEIPPVINHVSRLCMTHAAMGGTRAKQVTGTSIKRKLIRKETSSWTPFRRERPQDSLPERYEVR